MKHDHPATPWRTSSFSDGLQCIEVADLGDDLIGIRTTDGRTPTRADVKAFFDGVKAGEFDDLA
jgi:hypothetical protein